MSKIEDDNKSMELGIRQLLGKESYPEPTPLPPDCEHEPDGYVYNKDDDSCELYAVLRCSKCGEHYNVYKNGFTV